MSSQNTNNDSIQYAFLGACRGIAGHFFEHPFDVHKVRAQKSPHLSSSMVISEIYRTRGLKGCLDGFVPNLKKRAIKETYRWSLIKPSNSFWQKRVGSGLPSDIATAFSVAGFETLLLPLDRLLVAKVNEEGYRVFYATHIKNASPQAAFSSLYRGWHVVLGNRIAAWGTFVTARHFSKKLVTRWDKDQRHPWLSKAFSTGLTAASLSLGALPFDFMKTRLQIDKSNTLQQMKLFTLVKTLYRQHGLKGFYSGMAFDMGHRYIHVFLTGALFDKVVSSNRSF